MFTSFLSPETTIETSGRLQHQKSAIHGLFVNFGKSDWLKMQNKYSAHAQKNWLLPEVSIFSADQKDRSLWGKECVYFPMQPCTGFLYIAVLLTAQIMTNEVEATCKCHAKQKPDLKILSIRQVLLPAVQL